MVDLIASRERRFEAGFAHDEALRFKTLVRRNALFAAWVADQMGDAGPPDYAEDFREFATGREQAELTAKAARDLYDHGIALADIKLAKAFAQFQAQAETEMARG